MLSVNDTVYGVDVVDTLILVIDIEEPVIFTEQAKNLSACLAKLLFARLIAYNGADGVKVSEGVGFLGNTLRFCATHESIGKQH